MALTALTRACTDMQNNGGVKALYMIEKANLTSITIASNVATVITLEATKFWLPVNAEPDTIEAGFELKTQGRMNYTATKVAFTIPKFATANMAWLQEARKACDFIFAVEFVNGSKILLGWEDTGDGQGALFLKEAKGEGGKDVATAQNIVMTFEGMQIDSPVTYSASIVTS